MINYFVCSMVIHHTCLVEMLRKWLLGACSLCKMHLTESLYLSLRRDLATFTMVISFHGMKHSKCKQKKNHYYSNFWIKWIANIYYLNSMQIHYMKINIRLPLNYIFKYVLNTNIPCNACLKYLVILFYKWMAWLVNLTCIILVVVIINHAYGFG